MPQMMPLPWLLIFIVIFLCLYSIFIYMSSFFSFYFTPTFKSFKSSVVVLPW